MAETENNTILIEYKGTFTQSQVNQYMDLIEEKIENIGLMSHISTNFIEQYQNILNYGKSKDVEINHITPEGYIKLQHNDDGSYSVETINTITVADMKKIEEKLAKIKTLSQDEIKKAYKELRRSGKHTHDKGGGIGFYEIAKRCSKIEYNFTPINTDRVEFQFISFVSPKRK